MFKSPHLAKSLSSALAGLVLLPLMQVGLSSANTPAADNAAGVGDYDPAGARAPVEGAYASEVPPEAIDTRIRPHLRRTRTSSPFRSPRKSTSSRTTPSARLST